MIETIKRDIFRVVVGDAARENFRSPAMRATHDTNWPGFSHAAPQ
jgi:hypothetical protein